MQIASLATDIVATLDGPARRNRPWPRVVRGVELPGQPPLPGIEPGLGTS